MARLFFPRLLLPLALLCAVTGAHAHDEVVPPQPGPQPEAVWPEGRPSTHDVVVPMVVVVRDDGTVAEAAVEVSVSPELDAAALTAARRWRFLPGTMGGKPVTARARVAVRFRGRSASGVASGGAGTTGAVAGGKAGSAAGAATGQGRGETAATGAVPAVQTAGGAAQGTQQAAQGTPQARQGTQRASQADEDLEVTVAGEAAPRSASESVRDRRVVRAAPRRTASDALQVVPGVFVSQHGGEGKAHQIFFRGFDAVHGQDMEIQVAGAPVNDVSNVHGQGYADLHFVMPEVISAIRASPGAYDPRQGDFAVAGTLRMDLGYDEPGVTARASAGSFGGRRLFLAYHPESAPAETFAAFEAYKTDGFGPARAADRQSFVAQAVHDFTPSVRGRLMASTYAGRFDSAGVLRFDDVALGRVDRFASYDPTQGGASTRTQVVAELASGDEVEGWALAPFFVMRSMRLRTNYTGFLIDRQAGDATQQINEATTVGATAHYRRKVPIFSERDGVEAGMYARNDWITQSQARLGAVDGRPTEALVDARVRATNVAGWVDATLRPVRRVSLRGGVRADGLAFTTVDEKGGQEQARSAQGLHVGGKGTVDVMVVPGLHALASVGQGFRSPQARSLGDGERTPFTRVLSGEAGVRYGNEALRASAAVFHTRLTDDLVFDERTGRNEPVPSTARTGLAFDVVATPTSWFTSSVGMTYTRAVFTASGERYEEGALLPYVPQVVVRSDMAVTPRLGTIAGHGLLGRLGFGATLLHRRPMPYGEMGHDAMVVDAGASVRYRFAELGIEAFNLLDATWFDGEFVYASSFQREGAVERLPARHVTVGPPRVLLVSLTLFVS
ncbi:TonB-dependent receptor domain-containing protein [Chondromyces crocatus]|uniref:TonB-dependent receptor n=1 Tax=Chondromyces crocatus TaxID=52 RepID=A0A0K1EA34_CHOCO|nr:TonB-dependent receptor [Chondromyces crocatus]AKT37542.1 TonB-dependent receptor [Chondromyces crocatus]